MEKRVLAVLILAAFAGSAAAQSASQTSDKASGARSSPVSEPYVTSADRRGVMTGSGDCLRTGSWTSGSASCVQASRSAASAGPLAAAPVAAAPAATTSNNAAAGASRSVAATPNANRPLGSAPIAQPGTDAYVGNGQRQVVVGGDGLCVRTGSWTPAKAAEPCDAVPRASTPPAPIAAAPAPQPEPAAAPKQLEEPPQQQALAPAPVIEKVTLSTDVLFEFNKSELREGGKERLDQLAKNAQGANVDKVLVVGHADRIASEEYNKELSERRAKAVSDYLAQKGVDQNRLQIEGRGESQPITGDDCRKMGAESAKNSKLVACLQPDRRVEVELLGSRESTAGTPSAPAGAGASGAASSGSSSSGGTTK